jgi:hypothetical protein
VGDGMILHARLADPSEGSTRDLGTRADDEVSTTRSAYYAKGDSIEFRSQYISCSTCGFTEAATMAEADKTCLLDRPDDPKSCRSKDDPASRSWRPSQFADESFGDPGSMTCDSCSGTFDASGTKPCCTAQRLESGVADRSRPRTRDVWKPSASLALARPEPLFWV